MMTKAELHQLIDEIPASELLPAQRYLEYLRHRGLDPVLLHERAPESELELTPDEEAGLEAAWDEYRRGGCSAPTR